MIAACTGKRSEMINNPKGNQKHLTLSDRIYIEQGLCMGKNFKEIAAFLNKDPSTISKEIKKYRRSNKPCRTNDCMHIKTCRKRYVCNTKSCANRCSTCKDADCRVVCKEYVSFTCERLRKPPYVCNFCENKVGCHKVHYYYKAQHAYSEYKNTLTKARQGINRYPEELKRLDELISPLLKKGQSLSHIYATHANEIGCSRKTLYNYVDAKLFKATNMDLPRKVRYKPRKKKRPVSTRNYEYRNNRTYRDFERYMEEHPETPVVEMDTVKGTNEHGKTLLTMLFRNCSLMLMFLLPSCTQKSVENVFNSLTEQLGVDIFQSIFPVILTDNGSEFKDATSLEITSDGEIRTKVFFCDPNAAWQKARIEKNHEFIRYIIPKGQTMASLDNDGIILMANHINSVARDSLNGKTPIELAEMLINKKLLYYLKLEQIPHDAVTLKPSLLNR